MDGGTTWKGSSSVTGVSTGIYAITIEDAVGCHTTVNITIIEPTLFIGTIISPVDATCFLAIGAFSVSASVFTNPYQYSIDGVFSWQLSGSFNGYPA